MNKISYLPKELPSLKRITVYAVWTTDDERTGSIKGYYETKNVADIKAQKSGWYGSDGEVREMEVYTDGVELFLIERLGMFADKQAEFIKNTKSSILSKLTEAEILFIKERGL